jgi:hypothetical protein
VARFSLKHKDDGSLDIFIQRETPRADKEANWLPTAARPLAVTMRLYAPKSAVLEGRWVPPGIQKVNWPEVIWRALAPEEKAAIMMDLRPR